jgi:ADP-ribosyl-[dinitrogen reductase] hydrolase
VLAGEHPGGTTREATLERLQRLFAAGVECFIDLTEPGELKPYDVELPFNIEYLRKPIRDHGIPAQRLHMAEILDCLHDAVQSGRCVYVHCRAGIGRTGTVIGCLLVERGLAGDAALDELNRLWQFSERSQNWGSVPETDEQVGFVRKWKARGLFAVGEFAAGSGPVQGAGPTVGTAPGLGAAPGSLTAPGSGAAPVLGRAPAPGTEPVPRTRPVPGAPPLRAGVPTAGVATARGQAGPIAGVATERGQAGPVAGAPIRGRAPGNAPIGDELAHNLGAAASKLAIDEDPLLDPAALSAAQMLRDRFHGALIGLAVGDAVAAATQFRRPGTFTPVGDMLGGGPFDLPRGAWSDDTSMALCLADSLLECNGFDARDQMERYRRWQQEGYLAATGQCVGITASTARAIAIAQWRRQAFFGSHDPSQVDPEPLSRVAPAVLFFFASSGPAVDQATEAARTTCQSPVVLEACRSLARALYAALSGQPKAVVLEKAMMAAVSAAGDAVAGGNGRGGAGAGAVAGGGGRGGVGAGAVAGGGGRGGAGASAVAGGGGRGGAGAGAVTGHAARSGVGADDAAEAGAGAGLSDGSAAAQQSAGASAGTGGGAPAILAAAVAAFGATSNFRDAILYSANLGGDSDVIAAVCGQLAGAYYSVKAIPTSWYNGLMHKELIADCADRLLAHAMLGLSG